MRSLVVTDAYPVTSTDWCPGCEDYTPGLSAVVDGIVYRRCDACGDEDAYDVREAVIIFTEPTTVRHDVTILGSDVRCTCGRSYQATQWGPQLARRLAFAHLASPRADTEALLAFVGVGTDG